MQYHLSWFIWLLFFPLAWALKNVTVDDKSTMITYEGSWDPQDSHQSSLDYNGSHSLSNDPMASATFTFTGVSVYYLSALWPYRVNSTIAIDGGDSTFLNLTDPFSSPTEGGSASSPYGVRWAKTGLTNSTHEVVIAMAAQWILVDGFIYTTDNGEDEETIETQTVSDSGNSNVISIAVGASVGGLTLLAAIGLVIFFWRRRRRTNDQDFILDDVAASPFSPGVQPPSMAENTVTYSAMSSQYASLAGSVVFPYTVMKATSIYGDEDFNPYHSIDSNARRSLATSSTITSTNSAGLGVGMGNALAASRSNTAAMKKFTEEKRAQALALSEQPLPPPAYTPA